LVAVPEVRCVAAPGGLNSPQNRWLVSCCHMS
jgi:hypothetical protein